MTTIKLWRSQRTGCLILCALFSFFCLFVSKWFFIHFLLWQTLMPLTKFISLSSSCLCFFFSSTVHQSENKLLAPWHMFVIFHSSSSLLLNSSSALFRYFSLNQSTGVLTIRQNTPAGSYWLRVGVSDGVWPDVISGVRVHVRELEEKAILSSASLRLTGNIGRDTDSPNGISTC